MNQEQAEQYLLNKLESEKTFPFGPEVAVFKILGRMFATLASDKGMGQMNLKCDPLEAQFLRDTFAAVLPGYHMNKRHWNTIVLDGSIPEGELQRMMDRSYALVVRKLKKAERESLILRYGKSQLGLENP